MTSSRSHVEKPFRRLLPLLILAGALGLLFFPRIAPPSGLWWETAWNALHFPGFVIITVGLERLLSLFVDCRKRRILLAVAGAVFVAVGSELSHDLLGRSSSWGDVGFDLVGIAFAAILLRVFPRAGRRGRSLLGLAAMVIVLALLTPGWRGMLAAAQQRAAFPDLGAFSHASSLARWRPQGKAALSLDRERGQLQVRIGPGKYSGVSCFPAQGDWRNYRALHLELDNPGDPFRLGIRIDDASPLSSRHAERYNGQREVSPGRVHLVIPLEEVGEGPASRELDLGRVRRLALFTGAETGIRVFTVVSAFLD